MRCKHRRSKSRSFGTLSSHSKVNIGMASAIAIIILLRTGYWTYVAKNKQDVIKVLNMEVSESLQNLLFSLSLDSLFDLVEQLLGYQRNTIDRGFVIIIYLALTGLRSYKP